MKMSHSPHHSKSFSNSVIAYLFSIAESTLWHMLLVELHHYSVVEIRQLQGPEVSVSILKLVLKSGNYNTRDRD